MLPHQPNLRPLLAGLAAILLLAVVLSEVLRINNVGGNVALMQVTQSSAASVTETVAPTPPASASPEATETEEPTPDVQITETYIATILTQKAIAFATWQQHLTEEPLVPVTPPTGILDDRGDVFRYPSQDVRLENLWQNVIRVVDGVDYWAQVYAGAQYTDPTQGLVIVWADGPPQTYLSPIKAGSLSIVAEQNLRLTLISTDGVAFYFDVPGQRFVESLTEVVPTVTPFQTLTPTATETPVLVTPLPTCTPGPTPSSGTPGIPPCS